MSVKINDLPEFSSILDAHENVAGVVNNYAGDIEDITGIAEFEGPSARDWVEGLSSSWGENLRGAPYIAPLASVVVRISKLSGEPLPQIDPEEGDRARVMVAEGFDGDT